MNANRKVDTTMAEPPIRGRGSVRWRGIAQAIIGLSALVLVFVKSDAGGLAETIKSTQVAYLPLAVTASFVVTWLMAFRWSGILKTRGHRIETRRLFVYYLIGIFFTNFVPGGSASGDVARLIYADREIRDKAFVLSTLIYERLVGVFTIMLIGLIAAVSSRAFDQYAGTVYIAEGVLGLGLVAAATLMSEYISSRLARLIKRVAARFKVESVGDAAARTIEAIVELRRDHALLVRTVVVSVAVRIVWGLGCFAVVKSLNLPVGLPVVFAFISLVDVIRLLPISIGGLGVREWVLIGLMGSVGVSREQALAFSILAFAPIYMNAIAGGIIYISRARISGKETRITELDLESSKV